MGSINNSLPPCTLLFPRHARGSVLVFCVVLLSILALLATSYLLLVRQSGRASANAISTSDADIAAQAGLNHAMSSLREMVLRSSIVSPDGVYDATKTNYVMTPWRSDTIDDPPLDNDFFPPSGDEVPLEDLPTHAWLFDQVTPPPFPHAFSIFETRDTDVTFPSTTDSIKFGPGPVAPVEIEDFSVHALLFLDRTGGYNDTLSLYPAGKEPPYFSQSPMGVMAFPNGQGKEFLSGIRYDAARRFFVDGSTADFFPPAGSAKNLKNLPNAAISKRQVNRRGAYYVWLADMDAKLFANPNWWGLDTFNTNHASTLTQPENDVHQKQLMTNVIKWLTEYGKPGSTHPAPGWTTPEYVGLGLTDVEIAKLVNPSKDFKSVRDLALYLHPEADGGEGGDLDPTIAPDDYLRRRGALDYYFTTHADIPWQESPLLLKYTKDSSAAINVNTATTEVLAAALSQIPAQEDGQTLGENPERVYLLARRIIAKRPFMCRMDFEDFLAAHIMGSYSYEDEEGTLTDDLEDPECSFVRMIYHAIDRRWGPGHPLSTLQQPELTLSQYLEIPGIAPDDARFRNADGYPNEPRYQKRRFEYFFGEEGSPPVSRSQALITPKEFNNVINSVTRIYENDDDQRIYPNSVTLQTNAYEIVIAPGLDNIVQTSAHGDDVASHYLILGSPRTPAGDDIPGPGVIYPGPNLKLDTQPDTAAGDTLVPIILVGPNRLAETWISRNRPSYYSYCDDYTAALTFWDQIDAALWANWPNPQLQMPEPKIEDPIIYNLKLDPMDPDSITIGEHEALTIPKLRFYYRLPLNPWTSTPLPDGSPPYYTDNPLNMLNLLSWRAAPETLSKRAGSYQMSFDDWMYDNLPVGFGPMQALGNNDPDTGGDPLIYGSAKITSGVRVLPEIDTDDDGIFDGNGDVSWSPQFAFRSRFFGIYVLGRGLQSQVQPNGQITIKKVTGEKRLEAVYDALQDKILWQRAQTTDKRALGDPPVEP